MGDGIAGPLEDTGARAAALGPGQAVLVDSGAGTWLLWDGKRSPIDLGRLRSPAASPGRRRVRAADHRPGLFNAIPEAPLTAPIILDAGNRRVGVPPSARW